MSDSRHSIPDKNMAESLFADGANDPSVVHVSDWATESFL